MPRFAMWAPLPFVVACVACSSSSGGGGATNPPPGCPDAPPTEGSSCVGSLICTYGNDVDYACRAQFECFERLWRKTQRVGCPDPGAPRCPSSPPNNGDPCTVDRELCTYPAPSGKNCLCIDCIGGGDDAGVCNAPLHWVCGAAPTTGGCPAAYPSYGTTCSNEGLNCEWGSGSCGQLGVAQCRNGTWQEGSAPCQ